MASSSPLYGSIQTFTMTLASLASSASFATGRQSTVLDVKDTVFSSGGQCVDIHVGGVITLGTSPTTNRGIYIGLFASWDDATYTAGAGASDAAFTPDDISLLRLLEVIPTIGTSNKAYRWGPHSVAAKYGGFLPTQVGLYIAHDTGVALNATAGNHSVKWTPIKMQST